MEQNVPRKIIGTTGTGTQANMSTFSKRLIFKRLALSSPNLL